MENQTMGRVTVTAVVENLEDLVAARRGLLTAAEVRRVEVSEALVDTGTSILSMPRRLIEQIGQAPLEVMDFVVDPAGRRLIGNPEHGGELMYDQF